MGLRRKQTLLRQKEYFEHMLQGRLSFLAEGGIKSPKADKDTIVRKLAANVKAVKKRLKRIADNEKVAEETAKTKAERAAAPRKGQDGGKGEKPKKSAEEGKGKKTKAEKSSASPKDRQGGKS